MLQALVGLHRLGWIHCDIRRSNVVRQRDGSSWLLINFGEAATSPQHSRSGQHFSEDEHVPEIFAVHGNHTGAVDIWAVGYLMGTSGVNWCGSAARRAWHRRMIADDPASRPNAEEALRELLELEEAAKLEQGCSHEEMQEVLAEE